MFPPIKLPFAFKFVITCRIFQRFPQIASVRTLQQCLMQNKCHTRILVLLPESTLSFWVWDFFFFPLAKAKRHSCKKFVPKRADVRDVQNNLTEWGICNTCIVLHLRESWLISMQLVKSAILLLDESPNGGIAAGEVIMAPCQRKSSTDTELKNKTNPGFCEGRTWKDWRFILVVQHYFVPVGESSKPNS